VRKRGAAAASGIGWARLLPDSVEVRLILSSTGARRLDAVAVPVVWPPASRNVVVPFEFGCGSAGHPTRAIAVRALPIAVSAHRAGDRPLASRNVVCADAA
jgi:hypothetical protein